LERHEKNNFAKGLIKFVKDELKRRNRNYGCYGMNDKSDVGIIIDEEDIEIKELIDYLLKSEEGKIFRSIKKRKNKNYAVQLFINYFEWYFPWSKKENENEERAVQLLIDYFMYKWNKEVKNLKYMIVISKLLPYLAANSHKISIDKLIPKLNYTEIPGVKFTSTCSTHELSSTSLTHKFSSTRKSFSTCKFTSTNENFWSYGLPIKHSSYSYSFKFFKFLDKFLDRLYMHP
jgi:hypothetical protein